jgi:ornithine carbamoyltransferase
MSRRRRLVSIRDLSDADLRQLTERGAWFGGRAADGFEPLRGLVVGSFFRMTSTRTRTAFASAALRLGAGHVAYGPNDLQLNTGESIEDTARVFGRMLDALVVRTDGHSAELEALAGQERMAVINAMSIEEHPTQALADLTTMHRQFGRVDGLRVLYVGEGNNSAVALALALSRFGEVELTLCCPPGYGVDPEVVALSQRQAKAHDGVLLESDDPATAMSDADIVYTTRWQTTGTSKPDPNWLQVFDPFRVDERLMERHPRAIFMHDLPAHRGQEVTGAVLDGPTSIAFDQAENKLHSAKAVLEWCLTA